MSFLLAVIACALAGDPGAAATEWRVDPHPPGASSLAVLSATPITPGHRYALCWEMKVEGEKSWRFRAPFSGLRLGILDATGATVQSLTRHTSCYRTVDWQPAWYLFTAPPESASVTADFAIESDEALEGRYLLRNFVLTDLDEPPPAAPGMGRLRISAVDGDGKLTYTRLYVHREDGEFVVPPFSFAYELGGKCFYFQDPAVNEFSVAAGTYHVTAMRGFDTEIAEVDVEVKAGEVATTTLPLNAAPGLQFEHWYSGDHHTHLFRHGGSLYPMMNLEDVYNIARAEGLDFLPFMGADHVTQAQRDYRVTGAARGKDFIGMATEELTRDFWGHICPIGVFDWPPVAAENLVWPMNEHYVQAAVAAGGAIAYAHPYSALRAGQEVEKLLDLESGLIAREYPIDLALGLPCTLDILTKEDGEADFGLKLRDYMRLLNLGFRSGVSGATDFHLDQGRMPIGGARTYVYAGQLDWPSVARAYRQGNTFATNGPLLDFRVDGKWPGEVVHAPAENNVEVTVTADSLWGINVVEIWCNGLLLAELGASDERVEATYTHSASTSGWMLAIAYGDPAPEVMSSPEGKPMARGQMAISSPVYLEVAGRPLAPKADEARYFTGWVDAVQAAMSAQWAKMAGEGGAPREEDRVAIEQRLQEARVLFESLARKDAVTPSQP